MLRNLKYNILKEIPYAGEHDLQRETHNRTEELVGIRTARESKRRKILLARHFGYKAEGMKEMQLHAYLTPNDIAQEPKRNAAQSDA